MADRFQIVFKVIEEEMARPYKACSADCMFMAVRVVDEIQGTKLKKQLKGAYKSMADSKKQMVKKGFKSLADALDTVLERKGAASLVMGDIAIVIKDGVEHVAVCTGQHFIVKGEGGREVFLLGDVVAGFKV